MVSKVLVLGAAVGSAGAAIGFAKVRTEFNTWGIDSEEGAMVLPGDDIVADAEAIATRGIDIAAPPAQVWPWLVQLGYGRAGWYSYDEVDMDRRSAARIIPELQQLAVGDIVPTHPGGGFEVRILDPEKALVLYADRDLVEKQAAEAKQTGEGIAAASTNVRATGAYLDAAMRGDFQASWAFVLQPLPDGGTRLIERFRGHMELPADRPAFAPQLVRRALLFGLFVMVRRQMLGIGERAEGRAIGPTPLRARKAEVRAKAMAARANARRESATHAPA
jgi:hypothetical protein